MTAKSKTTGDFPKQLALAITSIGLTFLTLEFLVRVFDIPPRPLGSPAPIKSYQLSDHPRLKYEYQANYRGEPFDESHAGFETNSAGFRDRERSIEKPKGVIRILALGDSTTAGNGVPELENVYPHWIEKELSRRFPDKKIEVLNLGVGGYHTFQEIEMLRVKGLSYDPDFVLVGFCLNDFDYNSDGGVHFFLSHKNRHLKVDQQLLALALKSRLVFMIYHRLTRGFRHWDQEPPTPEEQEPVKSGFALLSKLERQFGFDSLIWVLPYFEEGEYQHQERHQKVAELAAVHPNLSLVDLRERLYSKMPDPRQLAWDKMHLNEKGHAILGEILTEEISKRWLFGSMPE
ncbi:SGNH/GDSL hydrolase family protein [Myxococcota bacterium]|nr:SGNH/GDSL hydrolase family protein [Myxococcota bacterium]